MTSQNHHIWKWIVSLYPYIYGKFVTSQTASFSSADFRNYPSKLGELVNEIILNYPKIILKFHIKDALLKTISKKQYFRVNATEWVNDTISRET